MGARPLVLVVDDEDDFCQSTCMVLEMLGCEAQPVADPGQVLEIAVERRPALILQDLRMAGLNLSGLMASLRSDEATTDVPVVFCSAHPDLPATAQRHGAWGYLRKPFDQRSLRRVLDHVLGEEGPSEDILKEVRDAFHDHWNLISALGNYTSVLATVVLEGPAGRAATGIADIQLKLEANTDRLQGYVSAMAQTPIEGSSDPE